MDLTQSDYTPLFGLVQLDREIQVPEIAISQLVWSKCQGPEVSKRWVYDSKKGSPPKQIKQTKPLPNDLSYEQLKKEFSKRYDICELESQNLVEVLLSEVKTSTTKISERMAAVPLNLQLALMQNLRGLTNQSNVPDIALKLEQINHLGDGKETVVNQLLDAYQSSNGLPQWLNEATEIILPKELRMVLDLVFQEEMPFLESGLSFRKPKWLKNLSSRTPFHWFASSWKNLCHGGWINEMPRRRWVDWATCLTRTAIGMTCLFEMYFYHRLYSALLSDNSPESELEKIYKESQSQFIWDNRRERSIQNINFTIRQSVKSGVHCMQKIKELPEKYSGFPTLSEFDNCSNGLTEWLTTARSRIQDHRSEFEKVVSDIKEPNSSKLHNAIRCLLENQGDDRSIDLYYLIKTSESKPQKWIDPGQEWLVTIASLCSEGPGQSSNLKELYEALLSIGISSPPYTLIEKLESYGLCRSSHDADYAIEIQPAY